MGSNDMLLMAAGVVTFIAAYTGNIGGFRTWLEKFASGSGPAKPPVKIDPNLFDRILPEGTVKKPEPVKIGCYNAVIGGKAGTCWRNIPCGGSSTVAWCTPGSDMCSYARTLWAQRYGCKSSQAFSFSYPGFDNITMA